MEESIVGGLINFRGLVYSPINEQGVVFLFGRILDDLNMYIEEVRTKYPDCVARRYTGKGWEKVYIEFEYQSSNFLQHGHDPKGCNMIVCWEDNLNDKDKKKLIGIEIIELKSRIDTPEIPNRKIKEPSKILEKTDYSLQHIFKNSNASKQIQELYELFDGKIKSIDEEIFRKFSKHNVTYYSPSKVFVYMGIRQNSIWMNLFTNTQKINGITNIKNHKNWGRVIIKIENQINQVFEAVKKSHQIMKNAVKNNENTGWFAKTSKDAESDDDFEKLDADP